MAAIYLPPWRIDLTIREGVSSPLAGSVAARTAARALAAAGAPCPASLGLVLADDDELANLNEQHMGHAGPTDVLSFPLLDVDAFPAHRGQQPGIRSHSQTGFALPPRARTNLGDIVISVDRAREQAAAGLGGQTGDVRWSAVDELRLLIIHGVLHICGWDHAEAEERDEMRALETQLLADT